MLFALAALSLAAKEPAPENTDPVPQFKPAGGVFTEKVAVTLTSPVAGAFIRYTWNGTEPTFRSPVLTNTLTILANTHLRARLFVPGQPPGPVVGQSYVVTTRDLTTFSSDLPLIFLNTFGTAVTRDQKSFASVHITAPGPDGRARVTGLADFDGRAQIHYRGFSSLRYLKRSYTVRLRDDATNKVDAPLLGLPKDSEWVLYAPYADKTLLRNVLAYDLSHTLGHYAPRTRFVEAFVNESGTQTSRANYMGVFVLMEKIKRAENRVNLAKLAKDDLAEPAITGGYIFKKDHEETANVGRPSATGWGQLVPSYYFSGPGSFPADPAGWRSIPIQGGGRFKGGRGAGSSDGISLQDRTGSIATRQAGQFFVVEPDPDKIPAEQSAWLQKHLNEFETVLYGKDFADPKKGYPAYLDAASFIDYHLLVELTKNVDGYRFSTFFSKDRAGKIKMEPVWDWDLAFGNANGKQGFKPESWYWPYLDNVQYPWFRRLFEDPDFAQRYVDRYAQLRAGAFSTPSLLARMDGFSGRLREAQARNFQQWPILDKEVWPNYYTGQSWDEELLWMRNFLRRRVAWIDLQFIAVPQLTRSQEGARLLTATPGAKIYYTLDGSDPRVSGGAVTDLAREYTGAFPLPTDTKLVARAKVGTRWSAPFTPGRK